MPAFSLLGSPSPGCRDGARMASRGPVLLQHHGGYREWWYGCMFGGGGVIGWGRKTEMVWFFSCKRNKWHPLHFCPCTVFSFPPLEIVTWGLLDPCQLLGTTGSRARKGVARLPTRRSPLGDLGMLRHLCLWNSGGERSCHVGVGGRCAAHGTRASPCSPDGFVYSWQIRFVWDLTILRVTEFLS